MTATPTEISYDALPYTNHPFAQTHPDRLAALATLFAVSPPAPARCRVLELGCASGGNLIPMAITMPDARFVGIDLSEGQIRAGRAIVSTLGVENVELRAMSIADIDASFGTFDYIVAHGVHSWVPDTDRRRQCGARHGDVPRRGGRAHADGERRHDGLDRIADRALAVRGQRPVELRRRTRVTNRCSPLRGGKRP